MKQIKVFVEQILMIVKTYPSPSAKYGELTCTAGIRLSDMTWIRVYPFPFRLMNFDNRFKKWQIVEMPIYQNTADPRPESYKLYEATAVRPISEIPSRNNWDERMPYIYKTTMESVQEFKGQMIINKDANTWGRTLTPVPVKSGAIFEYSAGKTEWDEKEIAKLEQGKSRLETDLFVDPDLIRFFKTLKPIPYKFYLRFSDLTGVEYRLRILDWEFGQLWFNEKERGKTDQEALEGIRYKLENQMFTPDREPYLILGNYFHQYKDENKIAIIGFIWPKRRKANSADQPSLF